MEQIMTDIMEFVIAMNVYGNLFAFSSNYYWDTYDFKMELKDAVCDAL